MTGLDSDFLSIASVAGISFSSTEFGELENKRENHGAPLASSKLS